jgi:hypothetical protein
VSRRGAGVAVLAGALALGSAAGAAVTTIDQPATVAEPADRIPPKSPVVGGCSVFPADNAWNQDISQAPLHPSSAAIIATIQGNGRTRLHPDFGENPDYGIPFVVVPGDQPLVPITYAAYGDESDPGPFPVPLDAPVEGGNGSTGDRHVLVLRSDTCDLFELYRAFRSGAGWRADSGARFDLRSNALRPLGWTSADAAGLPILPGLVRYEEVAAGEIRHAIRVTFSETRRGYVLPATHFASSNDDANLPPMGLRLRLQATFDTSQLTGQARVIAVAMQRYGLIVADNGSNWFFQGAPSAGWNDDDLNQLKGISGSNFEVVDTGPVHTAT